jgi:hypothetical protein
MIKSIIRSFGQVEYFVVNQRPATQILMGFKNHENKKGNRKFIRETFR